MNSIGGYFEFELPEGEEYHKEAISLNLGRNALEYIVRAKKYKKIYVPFYTCDVVLGLIKKLNLEYEFYSIDDRFYPIFSFSKIEQYAAFLYTNYFGLCDQQVEVVVSQGKNIIIDNSQGFFSKPLYGIDTFYSARKFFGVPDGAYLYTNKRLNEELEIDFSNNRCQHLLGRIDYNAETYYNYFTENESSLKKEPIKQMSKLTKRILKSIDYNRVMNIRRDNFRFLHKRLSNNKLYLNTSTTKVPMIYPYLSEDSDLLKQHLLKNKIYIPTYWPDLVWESKNLPFESKLVKKLCPIPIDQRLSEEQMKVIYGVISEV